MLVNRGVHEVFFFLSFFCTCIVRTMWVFASRKNLTFIALVNMGLESDGFYLDTEVLCETSVPETLIEEAAVRPTVF